MLFRALALRRVRVYIQCNNDVSVWKSDLHQALATQWCDSFISIPAVPGIGAPAAVLQALWTQALGLGRGKSWLFLHSPITRDPNKALTTSSCTRGYHPYMGVIPFNCWVQASS